MFRRRSNQTRKSLGNLSARPDVVIKYVEPYSVGEVSATDENDSAFRKRSKI